MRRDRVRMSTDGFNVFTLKECSHLCHERGLNPWIEHCAICGCENPRYDAMAVSDVDAPNALDLGRAIATIMSATMKRPR